MVKRPRSWSLYILRCADGTLYTGISNRLEVRLRNHSRGRGARYTRTRLPVELVYARRAGTFAQALKQEYRLKGLGREAKLRLARAWLAKKTVPRAAPKGRRARRKP